MTRLITPILALALGLAAAFAVVSCGSDEEGLLPGDTASEIEANLDVVQSRVAEGDCEEARAAAEAVSQQVDQLGAEVKRRLRDALAEGAERVERLAVAECIPAETTTEATTDTEPIDTEPTETFDTEPTETFDTEPTETIDTEPTETTPTETTPTEPTETTPTEPPPPPSNGGGSGGSGGIGPGRSVGPG